MCRTVSGAGSVSKLRDFDDWQDQRLSTTDDDLISPYSDSSTNELDQIRPRDLTKNGTYVIRRGRKKERKGLPKAPTKTRSLSFENGDETRLSDAKRYSSTFDNIRSLLREGKVEPTPPPQLPSNGQSDFPSAIPPDLVRVVSLPAINDEITMRGQLEVTVEEEETSDFSDKDKTRDRVQLTSRLSPSLESQRRAKIEQSESTNRAFISTSKSCSNNSWGGNNDRGRIGTSNAIEELPKGGSRKSPSAARADHRLASKIPVNLLIEEQIVKKALKENRRQLEKVSDAIKEIESVKNSESYSESKRWKNAVGDSKSLSLSANKRNSLEIEPKVIDGLTEARGRKRHDSDIESDNSKSGGGPEADFDGSRTNGADIEGVIYSSERRSRQNGVVESHKNDQKQIENVIDAILEDSKNPEFQVLIVVWTVSGHTVG